tara:strand:- start:1393 stop:2466 length:1074 start_codon:yes stop_codon:yes gene_type:complete
MTDTETSTPEPGPASEPITLDGVLESAISGEFTDGKPEPTPTEPRPLAGETSAEEVEVQSDPSDDAAEGQEGADVEATPDGEPEPDALAAPKTWPAEHREAFEHLPEDQRSFMLQREQERDAAFTRKTTDLAEQRRQIESLQGVLAPYKQQMQAHGISEAEYVSRLMTYDNALRQNPKLALQNLAQHYGIKLSGDSGVDYVEETPSDPQILQLQQQLNQTQAHIQTMQQSQVMAQQQQLVDQVESFSTAKDAKGNLKHPHFEKLRERMGRLVNAGETTDLNEAYGMALRLDNDLYNEAIANERNDVSKKADDRRKAAVQKAKKIQPTRGHGALPGGSVKSSDLDDILRNSIGSTVSG